MNLLVDIILIFATALVCNLIFTKFRQPTIIGYVLSGLIIGPYFLDWVEYHELEILAELGIILLMFTLGIEFSIDKIKRVKIIALGGGSLQIGLTILVGTGVALYLGWHWYQGIFLGCLIALSSSAIILKLLQEGGELDTLHGRASLGILLFQDLALVPMMIILPALAISEGGILVPLALAGGKAVIFLTGALLLGRFLLPRVFFQVARTRNREVFSLLVLTLCLSAAWISNLAGLSLALGAFVAGVVMSDSEYSLRTLSDILPFKDLFLGLFFISVGMLLNPHFVLAHPEILALVVLLILLANFVICTLVVLIFKYPIRVAIFVGAALSQIGEFSFVLAQMGKTTGLIGDYLYQLTLSGTIITMAVTPQMLKLGRKLPAWLIQWGLPDRLIYGKVDEELKHISLTDHVIVCGYGPIGEHITQVLGEHNIPHLVIDLNVSRIQTLRKKGIPAYYGDSSSENVLHHAGVKNAKAVVVTYADPHAARRTTALVKPLKPEVHLVARTRLPEDIAELRSLGADAVIEEEFEVSLAMAAWTLNILGVSKIGIEAEQRMIREDDYRFFIDPDTHLTALHRLTHNLPNIEIGIYQVNPRSSLAGVTLGEAQLRSKMGVTVVSVLSSHGRFFHPSASYQIQAGDVLTIVGEKVSAEKVRALIENIPVEDA